MKRKLAAAASAAKDSDAKQQCAVLQELAARGRPVSDSAAHGGQ